MVVRRDLLNAHPGLARAIYDGLDASARAMRSRYRQGWSGQHTDISIPWFTELYERNRTPLPEDCWTNGVRANRTTIDTYLRYFHEHKDCRRGAGPSRTSSPPNSSRPERVEPKRGSRFAGAIPQPLVELNGPRPSARRTARQYRMNLRQP